jgi:hypothetical protein
MLKVVTNPKYILSAETKFLNIEISDTYNYRVLFEELWNVYYYTCLCTRCSLLHLHIYDANLKNMPRETKKVIII